MQAQINLVGQDAELNRITTLYLGQEGYEVKRYKTIEESGSIILGQRAQLWIVDMERPTVKDYEEVKSIRRRNADVPIIVTTASKSPADRVLSLEIGVDDYMEKPFDPRELVLRAQRLLSAGGGNLRVGRFGSLMLQGYTIDEGRRTVSFRGREIQLTSKEFDLLMMFARHTGYALSREQILDTIWGTTSFCNYRVVDDLVRRLRSKLDTLRIETVYGHGYRACV